MSALLDALQFPLHGSRLIEASAGTGKTWTIAALYVRLVLGHGGEQAYARPLLPSEILVMTFTRAATRELSNRVRERLVQAAAYFRGQRDVDDAFLRALADACATDQERQQAARRLALAAESMDEAAIFTIDAWCQRMLREHAFDSGNLFDEELVSDERGLFDDAAHDYWRQQVYPLDADALDTVRACWSDVHALKQAVRDLVPRAALLPAPGDDPLAVLVPRLVDARRATLAALKDGWAARVEAMAQWINDQRAANPKCFNGSKLRADWLQAWCDGLRAWANDPLAEQPQVSAKAFERLTPEGIRDAFGKGFETAVPACFEATAALRAALDALEPHAHALLAHAATHIGRRMAALKAGARQFGFADMLLRLRDALEGPNGAALRSRIVAQYPVALVDEFQDTSPDQYRIFDLLYRVAGNSPELGLFLIGDPKQSIYSFRGADIHSYLDARGATAGRHYKLGTNFRSTAPLVAAVNQLFLLAEGGAGAPGFPRGAFRFRAGDDNPLPFDAVAARGRAETLVSASGALPALTIGYSDQDGMKAEACRDFFAHHCAEHIVGLLNDPQAGFREGASFRRLVPADIAILVRDRREAGAVRLALQRRRVSSVYLSDKDSVIDSQEAADVLRWLRAVAHPLDGALARAAFATRSAGLALAELARLSGDDAAWEERVEQLKALHICWQRQGVLAMLRRFVHELGLPARLLREPGGERSLTNLLHLAELLQEASRELEGEQALVRWLAEQIEGAGEAGDERVLRLESDAELVKVVTVHKSKGLEYPLVYLPYAATARKVDRRRHSFFEFRDADGARRLDLGLGGEAMAAMDEARLEEDLRLMYVALTRPRHFLWMGVAALGKEGKNTLHESALGYLLAGGAPIAAAALPEHLARLRGGVASIALDALAPAEGATRLDRLDLRPPLVDAALFDGQFERDWSVGSFSALARHAIAAPQRALDEAVFDEPPLQAAPLQPGDAPWHRFPRGSVPGNFLHEQLEWIAQEGFCAVDDEQFPQRLAQRCERAGWGHRADDAIAWLRTVVHTPLPPLGAPLAQVQAPLPEMEFWFPSEHLPVGELDALCRAQLLPGLPAAQLPPRTLHGMLKGFADLVFEHAGRYWVLDYKSNALGADDAAYTPAAMAAAMAAHRYDVQGAIYLLALHRLLRSRLGDGYEPARQLGGAVFLFLRGVAHPDSRGCHLIAPDPQLLARLDGLLGAGEPA